MSQAAEDLATSATPFGPPLVEREGVWLFRLQAVVHLLWGVSYEIREFLEAVMERSPGGVAGIIFYVDAACGQRPQELGGVHPAG